MSLQVRPTAETSFLIHADWLNRWCPSLPVGALRDELLNAERTRERVEETIVAAYFGSLADPPSDFVDNTRLRQIIAIVEQNALDQIGKFWMAPRLVTHLISQEERASFGVVDRAEFEAIFEFRNHIPADTLPNIFEEFDFKSEGENCMHAWLSTLPQSVFSRMRLALPFPFAEAPGRLEARSELFQHALDRLQSQPNTSEAKI